MGSVILENLIPLVFAVITPVLLLFVNKGIRMIARKWDLEEALVHQDKIDELVLKGIKAAEKKSMNAVKKGGERTPGEQKLDSVLKFVNSQLKAMGIEEKAAHELEVLIEAKLFDGATGVSGNVEPAEPRALLSDTRPTAEMRVPTTSDE
jgi:hypothetical protein